MTERPSSRSLCSVLVVALLGVSTGCLGAGGASATATPTTTPTPTATANTDCPPSLTVEEVDAERVDAESAVAYGNLTDEQQATFDRARNGSGSVEEFDYAWNDIDFVEYEGRYYSAGILVC
jgi:hypothetical protein